MSASVRAGAGVSETEVAREYFAGGEVLLSTAGVLKVIAVPGCVAAAVVWALGSGSCGGPGLAASGAAVAGAGALTATLLYAALALRLPMLAPHASLYTDVVLCTASGVLLVVTAVLSVGFCQFNATLDYVRVPLTLVDACLLVGSAAAMYRAVTSRWDDARGPRLEPPRPSRLERDLDV